MFERLLFCLGLLLSATLTLAVLVAPRLLADSVVDGSPFWRLLAEDIPIRRATLVCACGLLVTAFVFFRPLPKANPPADPEPPVKRKLESVKKKRSGRTIGA